MSEIFLPETQEIGEIWGYKWNFKHRHLLCHKFAAVCWKISTSCLQHF